MRAACTVALQAIASHCLDEFERHGLAAADGDVEALHAVRIALTRLRTAIRFFAPAVHDPVWATLRREAAWLSRRSGELRDVDVALQRQRVKATPGAQTKPWRDRRDSLCLRLKQTLHSTRYRQFIERLVRQCPPANDGATRPAPNPTALRAFSRRRLQRWQAKLIARGHKLERLGERKRHRLRIHAKRFRYALEWSLPILAAQRPLVRRQIAQAKLIQNALGKLNDVSTHIAQARTLRLEPLPSVVRLGRDKSQHRLLKTARDGFKTLRALKTAA